MSDIFLFMVLPYTALFIALTGSIYVYRTSGYRISSLSTQFFESRELFFGGLMMHWGIVILFFGHLTGFLIPRSVILWNGSFLRLLVLEGTALLCGISFLTGLVLLVIRRLRNPRLKTITTGMDMMVYLVLLTQAVTGVWIALGYRWGSSWYAAVLAPYLRSVLLFKPDIASVSALPLIVKIHITTAFLLPVLIPFSRFMHFLVFPFSYFWRPYILFIWNRNQKIMRRSTTAIPDVKAKNN